MPPATKSDRRRVARGAVALFASLALCLAAARGEALPRWRLGRWQADGSFLLDWEKQDDARADSKYETILFQERLHLRNTGAYVIDPRLLTLNLGGSFGLSQEKGLEVRDNSLRVGNGHLYDYAFEALLLSDRPYPVTVFANRNQSILAQSFGGRTDVTFESRGGVFDLREGNFFEPCGLRDLRASLDVHQELLNEDSAVFGNPFRRDETRNIVRFDTHKGGQRSDLDLRYEFNDVSDEFNPLNVFDSHTLRATHSVDFGPTFNRRLDSSLYFFARDGARPGNYVSLDEALHLDHYANLSTDYRYDFARSDSDIGATTTHSGNFALIHRLYERLTTTVDAHGTYQNFPNGDKTIYGGRGGVGYRRSLPWNGEIFADLHGGYQIDDNNFTTSRIDVVDEPHTAPPFIGGGSGFALSNTFVIADTVVVFDVRGGARLLTELNVDYILVEEGNVTRVVPLAASPIIQAGDPLEVSYAFAIDPDLKFSTATLEAALRAEFAWFGLGYEHLLSEQSRLAGSATDNFLIDQNLDRFSIDLHHQWDALRAEGSVAYEILRSTLVDSRTWRFGQALSYQPRYDLHMHLGGDQYLVDFPSENRQTQSYLVRFSIDWQMPFGASLSPFAGYSAFRDTDTRDEEIIDVGFRVRWIYRSLEISPSFTWADYRGRLNDFRAQLQITRRFF